MGVSQEKQEEEGRDGSSAKYVEENKTTLWGEGTTSKCYKIADELDDPWRWIILFLFIF